MTDPFKTDFFTEILDVHFGSNWLQIIGQLVPGSIGQTPNMSAEIQPQNGGVITLPISTANQLPNLPVITVSSPITPAMLHGSLAGGLSGFGGKIPSVNIQGGGRVAYWVKLNSKLTGGDTVAVRIKISNLETGNWSWTVATAKALKAGDGIIGGEGYVSSKTISGTGTNPPALTAYNIVLKTLAVT